MPKLRCKPLDFESKTYDTRYKGRPRRTSTCGRWVLEYDRFGDYWKVYFQSAVKSSSEIWRAETLPDAMAIAQFLHERSQVYR